MKPCVALLICILTALAANAQAELKLASPFGDHMVLQRGRSIPVWGWALPEQRVEVAFAAIRAETRADRQGSWSIDLPALEASSEPRHLTVSIPATGESIRISDVLVGEVWLCGGQSNMERQLGPREGQKEIVGWRSEAASADLPLIRELYVEQSLSLAPRKQVEARWRVCAPETVKDFTAVGFFFARSLSESALAGVPIGIIHSSWGGTPAEAWTSREGLQGFASMRSDLDLIDLRARDPEAAARRYEAQLEAWFETIDPSAPGAKRASLDLEDDTWEAIRLPVMWENAGHEGYDGVAWMRKRFHVPPSWLGQPLTLRLGAIDDLDTTFLNGKKLGTTSGWTTERVYEIPSELVRAGENVVAIRILDTGGGGGVWNESLPLEIGPSSGEYDAVSLAGEWRVRFGPPLDWSVPPPMDVAESPSAPTALFNAMIAPLVPYAMRGCVFYQGEANAGRAEQYARLLPALIEDWRSRWGQGSFPFLYVQIAPFSGMPPEIREAQLQALKGTSNTAMAVTIDVGDARDIHPALKKPVGERLALAARALAYGEGVEYSGPLFEQCRLQGTSVAVEFSRLGGGLVAPDGELIGFEIADGAGAFRPAVARIVGDQVLVSHPAIAAPKSVRYAWANVARGNLYNKAGLPASPFRCAVE
ncbi:sialate O-acetylesterase [Pelagicoccus sp. SDUM812003]|uniref:sialate O-acetylesterase n=1 Tax=Pelagicoccus sp. SDUM812003 TaxID=3041267 RepID=UPI00280CE4C9|nr:sialate O-acetylesterase [Pelagicoccus sp. SDUM812003]MDQ8205175.1 sialate O-acetylesterase [Pelagicoccus sp. SDUM812003]